MMQKLLLIALLDIGIILSLYLLSPAAALVFSGAAALLTGGIYLVAWAAEQIEPTRVTRLFFSGIGVSLFIFLVFAIFFYHITQ